MKPQIGILPRHQHSIFECFMHCDFYKHGNIIFNNNTKNAHKFIPRALLIRLLSCPLPNREKSKFLEDIVQCHCFTVL